MKYAILLGALLAVLAGKGMAAPAVVPAYHLVDLGTWGGSKGVATGINNAGVIVGWTQAGTWSQAVLHNVAASALTYLETEAGGASAAYGINDAGVVVGQRNAARGNSHAMRWDGPNNGEPPGIHYPDETSYASAISNSGLTAGTIDSSAVMWTLNNEQTIQLNPSSASAAYGVNENGLVVGAASDGVAGPSHATQWLGGVQTDLGTLSGADSSAAYGVNDAGQVVGASTFSAGGHHAVLWSGGQASDLGTLGGANSRANDINASGLIVGYSDVVDPLQWRHAALWNGSTQIDLNSALIGGLGNFANLAEATAINDLGQIVGYGSTLDGSTHAFLLTATIPEPSTCAMTLAGLALFGMATRRRQRG
ncbi:PEP-CTERM sorting domain-containing protein [Oxalobacteraceae bacterium]|nr:PEP-CTERM sorting domain-containing protein [Oxalobacteraceae bacterium]